MASEGYPGDYRKGDGIDGLDEAGKLPDVVVFHAGTTEKDGKVVTAGGRVLGVTAVGDSIREAIAKAYEGVKTITWRGVHYRSDIGGKALARENR